MTIKFGDIVRRKSGGKLLTVHSVDRPEDVCTEDMLPVHPRVGLVALVLYYDKRDRLCGHSVRAKGLVKVAEDEDV